MKKPETKTSPRVDNFLSKAKQWKAEMETLRSITLDSGLDEDFKWGHPCYTSGGKNVVLIHGFKEYCALLFFKGALLKDPRKILVQQTENVQAARQIRFSDAKGIAKMKKILKEYIKEAAEIEKSGGKVEMKKMDEYAIPEEFRNKLAESPALKSAFENLTPGRRRAYLLYFSGAKQSRTREARVEKCIPMILDGVGLND